MNYENFYYIDPMGSNRLWNLAHEHAMELGMRSLTNSVPPELIIVDPRNNTARDLGADESVAVRNMMETVDNLKYMNIGEWLDTESLPERPKKPQIAFALAVLGEDGQDVSESRMATAEDIRELGVDREMLDAAYKSACLALEVA